MFHPLKGKSYGATELDILTEGNVPAERAIADRPWPSL